MAAASAGLLTGERYSATAADLDAELGEQARDEAVCNPRHRWLGERPRGESLRILARCRHDELRRRFDPARERESWRALLAEVAE
jgi:hypothetical protein